MVTAQVEDYVACLEELKALYPQHWRELAIDSDIPLSPRYDVYEGLHKAGVLILVTLRDGVKLAGYFLGFVMPELHYSTCLACLTDIFFILPEYRRGFNGTRLFRAVEQELRRLGTKRWYAGSKNHRDSGALLRRMGFTAMDTGYSKRLA